MKKFILFVFTAALSFLFTVTANQALANECEIGELEVTVLDCDSNGYFNVSLDFDYANVGDEGFSIKGNGNDYGDFEYEDLPVLIGPLEGDGETEYEFVVIDNQFDECSNWTEIDPVDCEDNGEECFISELTIDDHPCEEGNFNVYLNFEYENVSEEGFILYVNNDLYDDYSYEDLPLNIGPFLGDGETIYHFLVRDQETEDCASDANFGPIDCEGDCNIWDMEAIALPCNDENEFEVLLNFLYENIGDEGFEVRGNGNNYGTFEYEDLPITLGPFVADGSTEYEFESRDKQFDYCYDFTSIEPFECDTSFQFTNLNMEIETCENQSYYLMIDFDFINEGVEGFTISGNGMEAQSYNFGDLPVRIGPLTNDEITSYYFIITNNGEGSFGDWYSFFPFSCESLGLNENTSIRDYINVYPNPSDGLVYFRNQGDLSMEITVYDITGKKINNFYLKDHSSEQLIFTQPGLYFYRTSNGTASVSGKFTVR